MPLLRRRPVPAAPGRGGSGAGERRATALIGCALGATLLAQGVVLAADVRPVSTTAPTALLSEVLLPGQVRTAPPQTSVPVAVRIPRLGVDARLVGLRVQRDGTLAAPADYDTPGWYSDGVAPGDIGPAVLVGHVDSTTGPAVFHRVGTLRPKDVIDVRRADGSTVRFRVDSVARFAKDRFPTAAVYGATKTPTLRLITCGGRFDRRTGHYRDNVVAFATALPPTPKGTT